ANSVNLRMPSYDPVAAMQYVRYLSEEGLDTELQGIVDQILQHVPQFGPALLERAKRFQRLGDLDKAMEAARLTLNGMANDINIERAAHGILAQAYFALGRTAEAEQEQTWIKNHPNPETPQR